MAKSIVVPLGLWSQNVPWNHELDGIKFLHEKGQFWGKGSPISRDFLSWAVRKWLYWSICCLSCGLGWAEGSTSSIVFGRLGQYAQFQLHSPGGANVPDDTLRWAVQKWLNWSICRLGCGLVWHEGSTSSIIFVRWRQYPTWVGTIVPRQVGTLAPPGEYDWTLRLQRQCSLMSNYFDHLLLLLLLLFCMCFSWLASCWFSAACTNSDQQCDIQTTKLFSVTKVWSG